MCFQFLKNPVMQIATTALLLYNTFLKKRLIKAFKHQESSDRVTSGLFGELISSEPFSTWFQARLWDEDCTGGLSWLSPAECRWIVAPTGFICSLWYIMLVLHRGLLWVPPGKWVKWTSAHKWVFSAVILHSVEYPARGDEKGPNTYIILQIM